MKSYYYLKFISICLEFMHLPTQSLKSSGFSMFFFEGGDSSERTISISSIAAWVKLLFIFKI